MSIVEKLGIKSIERLNGNAVKPSRLHKFVCVDPVKLTEKENQYNELLEALITECIYMDTLGGDNLTLKQELQYTKWTDLIEKADPQNRSWEEIKELI